MKSKDTVDQRIREIFESQRTADDVVHQLTEYFSAEGHFPSILELSSMPLEFLTNEVGIKAYHASFIKDNIMKAPPAEFQGFPSIPAASHYISGHPFISGRKLSPYTPHQVVGVGLSMGMDV